MLKLLIGVVLLVGLCTGAPSELSKCRLSIQRYSFVAPIFFNADGTLVNTIENDKEGWVAVLEHGQNVTLSCDPNYFKLRQSVKSLTATCNGDQSLLIDSVAVRYDTLSCDLRPTEEVLSNVRECDSQYRGIKYGITNPIKRESYVLGESCYSVDEGRTIFAHAKLRNNGFAPNDVALSVENEDYFKTPHPSSYYRIEFLKATNALTLKRTVDSLVDPVFAETSKLNVRVENFIGSKFLSDKQFLNVLRFTWNSYTLFNEEVGINLALLHKDILELGVFNLELWTGGAGVTKVPGKNGKDIDLYLRDNKFPVSKYIWSVVKSNDKATVFVLINNPTISENDLAQDPVCASKCDKITWITNLAGDQNYKKVEHGAILCCSLSEVRAKLTDIPDIVDIVGLFK